MRKQPNFKRRCWWWCKRLRYSTREDIQLTNKHKKGLLGMSKMETTATMRHHSVSTDTTESSGDSKPWQGCAELSSFASENAKCLEVLKHTVPHDPVFLPLCVCPRYMKILVHKKTCL